MVYIRIITCLVIAFLFASCSNTNEQLEKIIPIDAVGVISVDVPHILKKGNLINDDGGVTLPESLNVIIDNNDGSYLCQLLTDVPVMGINSDSRIYVFSTLKTFATVTLVSVDDDEAARKVIERRTGSDFKNVEGLDCIYVEDRFYTICDHVLFLGCVNKPLEISKVASAAKNMLVGSAVSVLEDDEIISCIHAENDINSYVRPSGLKLMLKRSNVYREIASKMPLLEIFTESDVQAYICNMNFNEKNAELDVKVKVDDNSEYIKLLDGTLSDTSADFLNAIPISMDYIMGMSVNGANFVKLPQVSQLIKMFKKMPYLGKLDIESMLQTINGPVAAGLAHDTNLDEWNMVIAAKSNDANGVLNRISAFASSLGQAPEIYNNEYIYQYENKMIKLGMNGGILYVKMLNYEQTEGYACDDEVAKALFAKSSMGTYIRMVDGQAGGVFTLGLVDKKNIHGAFIPVSENSVVGALQVLCSIKPANLFDNIDSGDVVPGAIDKLQPIY